MILLTKACRFREEVEQGFCFGKAIYKDAKDAEDAEESDESIVMHMICVCIKDPTKNSSHGKKRTGFASQFIS